MERRQDTSMKVTTKVLVIFLIGYAVIGCVTKIHNENIIYFDYMYMNMLNSNGNLGVIFDGRTRYDEIHNNRDKYKQYEGMENYYKVYHKGMPIRIEVYNRSNDNLKSIYYMNGSARPYSLVIYKSNSVVTCKISYKFDLNRNVIENINQSGEYKLKFIYFKEIFDCDDNTRIVETSDPKKRKYYKKYYKNNKFVKQEVPKGLYTYTYNAKGKLIRRDLIISPIVPIHVPEWDDYPFSSHDDM